MTEPKQSIADRLNVTRYDESTIANLDRAAEATPVVGTVWKAGKSIAQHAQEATQADDLDDLAASSRQLAADGAKFVGSAAADVTFFLNESSIGGDQSAADTRRNLDIQR